MWVSCSPGTYWCKGPRVLSLPAIGTCLASHSSCSCLGDYMRGVGWCRHQTLQSSLPVSASNPSFKELSSVGSSGTKLWWCHLPPIKQRWCWSQSALWSMHGSKAVGTLGLQVNSGCMHYRLLRLFTERRGMHCSLVLKIKLRLTSPYWFCSFSP